jgi:hypothetical protein
MTVIAAEKVPDKTADTVRTGDAARGAEDTVRTGDTVQSDGSDSDQAASQQQATDRRSETTPVPAPVIPAQASAEPPAETPEPEAETERGKTRKARKAVRGKSAGGTKALVVWREGRVQYADDAVLVVDLDEAASPDTDVHDVVDRMTELREALDSPGRTDAVAALAEIIQDKALS